VLDALEELDDIIAYDAVKSENPESIHFEKAVQQIQAGYRP